MGGHCLCDCLSVGLSPDVLLVERFCLSNSDQLVAVSVGGTDYSRHHLAYGDWPDLADGFTKSGKVIEI